MAQSNEPTIEAMNLAIALFMGYKKREKLYPTDRQILEGEGLRNWYEDSLKYHTSWDWLMPVVEKIEKLENGRFGFTIDPWGIGIIDYLGAFEGHGETVIINVNREPSESTLLNDYCDAVYQFITWYNQQKQTNETNNGQ